MKKILFVCLIIFGLTIPGWTATYYVDTASVGGNGTTQELTGANAAFKTVAAAQAAITGDQSDNSLLFKTDCIWREFFSVGANGTAGHPFTIGSYGTGANPEIIASTNLNGAWTNVSGNIYKIACATEAKTCLNGSTVLTLNAGNFATLAANEWDWEANELYVNIGVDPSGGDIEAGQRDSCITVGNKNYVTIENIICRNANFQNFNFTGTSQNIILSNCESYAADNEGFKQWNTTQVTYNNITAKYNGLNNAAGQAISLHGDTGGCSAIINTCLFEENYGGVSNINDADITVNDGVFINNAYGASHGGVGAGVSVYNNCSFSDDNRFPLYTKAINILNDQIVTLNECTIVSNKTYGIYANTTETLTLTNTSISGAMSGGAIYKDVAGANTINVSGCDITNTAGPGIYAVSATTLNVSKSILYNMNASGIRLTTTYTLNLDTSIFYGFGIAYMLQLQNGGTYAATIKNCVLYDSDANSYGIYLQIPVTLYNTIINGLSRGVVVVAPAVIGDLTLSNNCMFGNTNNFFNDGGAGANTNGLNVNPLFISTVTPNFQLKPASPCINAGMGVGLTTDYEGKAVPQGGAVDIGAYEYNSSGAWFGN